MRMNRGEERKRKTRLLNGNGGSVEGGKGKKAGK